MSKQNKKDSNSVTDEQMKEFNERISNLEFTQEHLDKIASIWEILRKRK